MAEDFTNKLGDAAEKAEGLSGIFDRLMIKGATLAGLEEKQIQATQKANKLQAQLDREKKKAVPLQKKMTIELQQRLKNSTLLNKGLKETIKSMNLFSKTMSGLGTGLKGTFKGIGALGKAGAIGGMVAGVKFLVDGLLKVDAGMANLVKRLGTSRSQLQGLKKIVEDTQMVMGQFGFTFEQINTEAGNLALQFGSIGYVTGELVNQSLRLQKELGLSAQASGELLESLERTNKSTKEFIDNVGVKSRKEAVLTNLVMRDLASQSQMIAIQSSRGVESMTNLAVEAAKAGGSLKDFAGLESTYSDVEKASAAIGRATTLMGSDIAKHMGNIQELRMMYERGETDKILARVQKATAATVKLNKEGNLVNMQGRELLRSEVKAMAELAGMEEGAYKLMAQAHLEELKFDKLIAKQKAKTITDDEKAELAKLKTRRDNVQTALEENALLLQQQTIVERLENIAKGVFGRITTAFSSALGIDTTGEGSILGEIDKIQKKIESVMSFETLGEDIAKGETPLRGFIDGMQKRLQPLFDIITEKLISAFQDALTWFGENYDVSVIGGIFGGDFISEKKKPTALEKEVNRKSTNALAFSGQADALGRIHKKPTAALVGEEGRGEVVVSRSALRSGIGVGGRAASALASIGVPGFFRGGMVGDVTGRQGLMTGFGSEASRGAQAAAFQKEQAIQQAAMVNYWREYYENKRDGMDRRGPKKDDKAFLKEFFMQNRRDLKLVSDIMLENQHSAAKETNEAVFAAMTAWSKGAKSSEALKLGVRVGMTESMKPGGTMYNMFDKTNKLLQEQIRSGTKTQATIAMGLQSMSMGIQSAMAMYARTGDMGAAKESMKRTAVSSGVSMLATKLFGEDAMSLAKQVRSGQVPRAAKGKYVNSPTLMMVGEEGRGEVVIPTERIRKGLPINKGVAAELASIGVPGFDGKNNSSILTGLIPSTTQAGSYRGMSANTGTSSLLSGGTLFDSTIGVDSASKAAGLTTDLTKMSAGSKLSSTYVKPKDPYKLGDKDFIGGAKASGAAAALSFAQVYMQTGNMRLAAQAGLEAGVSMAATALLSIPPSNPVIGSILGPIVGSTVAGPLGKRLGITGGQGKARRRTLKGIEDHVKAGGLFDFGQPSGLRGRIRTAVGGKENVPTEENYNKLVQKIGSSQVLKPLWQAGIDPSVIVAAASGKLNPAKAFTSFKAINEALYGSAGGDKYMKAVAVPQLATGGIVTKPTTAVVGEAGPEMVIPLTEQRQSNDNMIKELKEQNKLMREMIKVQQETGKTEVRLDGRVIAQSTAENFYDIGNGM